LLKGRRVLQQSVDSRLLDPPPAFLRGAFSRNLALAFLFFQLSSPSDPPLILMEFVVAMLTFGRERDVDGSLASILRSSLSSQVATGSRELTPRPIDRDNFVSSTPRCFATLILRLQILGIPGRKY
jgi:hypothetical protein